MSTSIPISENAKQVLKSRYLLQDSSKNLIETPEQLFARVCRAVAKSELSYGTEKDEQKWEGRFYELLSKLLFLPNSPTLMNAGKPRGQLSACFVLPLEDSIESIYETLKNAAKIQQSGGGTGFDFSKLRPKGSWIESTGGLASGPVSFIKIFDCSTKHIKQGGKRRGANMGVLNIRHPDIEEFIRSKQTPGVLSNFNISVGIEDRFMHAVAQNEYWELRYPVSGRGKSKVKARKLWNLIVENAWEHGDPGLLFLRRIQSENPTPKLGTIDTTNPCGEMPLLPFESCNLGSINLSQMVRHTGSGPTVNWELLEDAVISSVRFLDNVIDVNHYLLYETKLITLGNRKIGLGVMGWAEMLIKLGIPYASNEAVALAETVMKFISHKSRQASENLAEERGAFPNWSMSLYGKQRAIRNATRTSIAPTGTLSIIANTSSSIEPLYALAYRREHILNQESQVEINPLFAEYCSKLGWDTKTLMAVIQETGQITDEVDLPEGSFKLFQTALQIPYEYHIKHQVAFQKYTDNAVSKTINLPADCSKEDVSHAFTKAWKQGVKGVTIFRSGSRNSQVLNPGLPTLEFPDENGLPCKTCFN